MPDLVPASEGSDLLNAAALADDTGLLSVDREYVLIEAMHPSVDAFPSPDTFPSQGRQFPEELRLIPMTED